MNGDILLTFNPGSSTIKLGLFAIEANGPRRIGGGLIDLRNSPLTLHVVEGPAATDIPLKAFVTEDLHEVIDETLGWLKTHFQVNALAGVGHRVVHGGDRFAGPEAVSDGMLDAIEALVPLAPLHQPQSIRLIRAIRHLRPGLPQIASFDTAFHRSQSDLMRRFALPRGLFDQGVKRYGFHGLSYKFVAARLQHIMGLRSRISARSLTRRKAARTAGSALAAALPRSTMASSSWRVAVYHRPNRAAPVGSPVRRSRRR
jgi:acetate kinase